MHIFLTSLIIWIVCFAGFSDADVGKGDNRFFLADEFLFEEYVPQQGDASIECIYGAIDMFPLSAPYYSYFHGYDIRLKEDIYPNNISALIFSKRMTDEAFLLPSGGDVSPLLMMESLVKKMCPGVKTQANYKYKETQKFEDYLLIKTSDKIDILPRASDGNDFKDQIFAK